jgi:hypothetical protein
MIDLHDVLQWVNVLVVPAFGYIVVLERRITRMQTQIENLIDKLRELSHAKET